MTIDTRKLFINQLRTNPNNRVQYFGGGITDFVSPANLCALGCGAEAFGFNAEAYVADPVNYPGTDPYDLVKEILGISEEELGYIWRMNDFELLSYSQIADILEQEWQ